MRILAIEPDTTTASTLELMLKSEGMVVFTTDLGEEGCDLAVRYAYDLVLLADHLPDMSGLDALRTLRAAKVAAPVIVLARSGEIDAKVKAFAAGADDYMTKPFHKDELVARIRSIVRRSAGHAESVITVGPIALSLDSKTVRVGDQPVHLTGKEYQCFELLALRRGSTLTKEMFLSHLYGGMDEPEIKIIDVYVCKLRNKLKQAAPGAEKHLATIWGRGYALVAEPAAVKRVEPVTRDAASSFTHRVLERIAQRPTNGLDLRRAFPMVNPNAIAGALAHLRERGSIVYVGKRKSGYYATTEAGRALLAKHARAAA